MKETFVSNISGKEFPSQEKVAGNMIRPVILGEIRKVCPDFNTDCNLSVSELNMFRQNYVASFLAKEVSDLTSMEEQVVNAVKNENLLVDKLEDIEPETSLGEKIADKVAAFGGSWTFIISFLLFIVGWISLNIFLFSYSSFDPYPFILLNLLLSTLAALQAPIIMMSQNRQEDKDRDRAKKDFMVNLKAELEIRMLHEKLDHLILHQQQEIIEIQKVQVEMMDDIMKRVGIHNEK